MKPKVSVVMATYNCRREYLIKAVESVLRQTFEDFEFIIIDDHSTNYKVKDVLTCFSDKRMQVYRNSVNFGLTKSLNIGVRVSKAELIARMDSDDIAEKFRLRTQYRFLKKNIMYSFVGSDAVIINNSGGIIRRKNRIHSYEGVCFYAYINNPFMHSAMMFYKNCFCEIGGYNEYFQYAQDYDLWCRFLRKYRGLNIPQALIRWRENNEGISSRKCREQGIYADEIVLAYFRSTLPELKDVSDAMLLAVRHNRFNRNNVVFVDKVVRTMYTKYICDYSREWYNSYLTKTRGFR